jgi:catalase
MTPPPVQLAATQVTPDSGSLIGKNRHDSQAGNLFRLMTSDLQHRLFGNIARLMAGVPREIQLRQICQIFSANPAYGIGVANALGFSVERTMSQLSQSQAHGALGTA